MMTLYRNNTKDDFQSAVKHKPPFSRWCLGFALLLSFLPFWGLSAQKSSDIESFRQLFPEIEFDALHVYSFARVPGTFPSTSVYPFKGQPIDDSFFPLFWNLVEPTDSYSVFYACQRFFVTGDLEVLLIREFHDGGQEHHIHYLLRDLDTGHFTYAQNLTFAYGYEGGEGGRESWILDIDRDDRKDILSRTHRQYMYMDDDGEVVVDLQDSITISLWQGDTLRTIGIADSLLKLQVEEEFPFYNGFYMSYSLTEGVMDYLKKEKGVEPLGRDDGWLIVAGSDKDLPAAEHEIKRAERIFGERYKYGLSWLKFNIWKRGDRYYTVIRGVGSRVSAGIILNEIKKKFNDTAYLLKEEDWCPNREYKGSGYYYDCID